MYVKYCKHVNVSVNPIRIVLGNLRGELFCKRLLDSILAEILPGQTVGTNLHQSVTICKVGSKITLLPCFFNACLLRALSKT